MFTMENWPHRCGFRYDHRRQRWQCGDCYLRRDDRKNWKLFRGESDLTGTVIATRCLTRDAIDADLAATLREKMGGACS